MVIVHASYFSQCPLEVTTLLAVSFDWSIWLNHMITHVKHSVFVIFVKST